MQLGNLVMFHDVVGAENTGRWGFKAGFGKFFASGEDKTKNSAAGRRCVLRCRLELTKNKRIQKTRGRDTGQFKHIYTPREPNAEVVLPCEARLGDSIIIFCFLAVSGNPGETRRSRHACQVPATVQLRKADWWFFFFFFFQIKYGPPWA